MYLSVYVAVSFCSWLKMLVRDVVRGVPRLCVLTFKGACVCSKVRASHFQYKDVLPY